MREIKFRGRERESNKWVFGYVRHWKCCYGDEWHIQGKNDNVHIVIPETVGQFTGLCDANGREIYEGDVIKLDNDVYTVAWAEYSACWFVDLKNFGPSLFTQYHAGKSVVVGNIHDSPELLGADDERD